RFNGKVDVASVLKNTFCQVEGLGERVPVRDIAGVQRRLLLDAMYIDEEQVDESLQVVQCQRRLPAQAKVRLIVGPGVQSAGSNTAAVSTRSQYFDFDVRQPFRAEFSCLR